MEIYLKKEKLKKNRFNNLFRKDNNIFFNIITNKANTNNIYFFINFKLILYFILLLFFTEHIGTNNILSCIILKFSNITLKINGTGYQNIFGNEFKKINYPDIININGIRQNYKNYSYYFNESMNTIKLIWNNNINNCKNMFFKCSMIISLDLSNFITSEVENMGNMFGQCSSLTSLDVSNFDTSQVRDMGGMFSGCSSLNSIYLSNFITSQVEFMSTMFSGCSQLIHLNLDNFDTSKVTVMDTMFSGCSNMISLNLVSFNTSNVTSMSSMFYGCSSLISLNLSNFNTTKVINMGYMFFGCSSLTSLNLTGFNTSEVSQMYNMFKNCVNLEYINMKYFEDNKLDNLHNYFYIFAQVPDNIVVCVNNNGCNIIFSHLNKTKCYTITCSEDWKSKQKKIINETGVCVNRCEENEVNIYEYNGKCYDKCTYGLLIGDNNLTLNQCKCELEKCLTCPSVALQKNLCTKCNYGYYPKENDPLNLGEYFECYKDPEGYYLDTEYNIYKKCYYKCKTCDKKGNDNYHNCLTCNDNYSFFYKNNCYINCSYYYYFDENNNYHCTNNTSCPKEYPIFINDTMECIKEEKIIYTSIPILNKDGYISHELQIYNFTYKIYSSYPDENTKDTKLVKDITEIMTIKKHQIEIEIEVGDFSFNIKTGFYEFPGYDDLNIYKKIIDDLAKDYNQIKEKEKYIKTNNNSIYEVTTIEKEIESLNNQSLNIHGLSLIDFGKCTDLLKNKYYPEDNDNTSFILLKYENITNISYEKNIQYEVYETNNFSKLNLSICENVSIDLYISVEISETTQQLIESLKEIGYENIFNIDSPFYQDVCYKYTTQRKTDLINDDRKRYIYENISKELQCQDNCTFSSYNPETRLLQCKCKPEENINTVENKNLDFKKSYQIFYDVLKYSNYRVLKCIKHVFNVNNFSFNKGFLICFCLLMLFLILFIVFIFKKIVPFEIIIGKKLLKINFDNNDNFLFPPKKKKAIAISKLIDTNRIDEKRNSNFNFINLNSNFNYIDKNNRKLTKKLNTIKPTTKKTSFINSIDIDKNSINNKTIENKNLDNYELNDLEYDEALEFDNRSFLDIYWSTLKREHIIIFTFFIRNDYNLSYIKYSRFLILIATDMAMNVFFFENETMTKLFLSYGKYDFIQQIPQIIYSKIISNVFELYICYLTLTDKYFYKIKSIVKSNKMEIFDIIKCIKIKLILFFISTFIIFLIYLYIITAFCAVYENTQIIFIKDCLSSFVLGLFEPFIFYFFPCIFRFIALRCCKGKLKFLYKISDIIPIF